MIWRAVFLLAGFAVIGVEAWGTFDFLYADQRTINYIVVGGCAVTVLSGILPVAASKAWASGRIALTAAAWLLVPMSLAVVFMATISRTGGAADKAQSERVQAERAITAAQKTVDDLEKSLARQQSTADFECSSSQKGRGLKCADAEKAITDTQSKLIAARSQLVKAPGEPVDSLSVRISAMTGGKVTQDQARMFQPAILPIIMSLVGAVLVAVGAEKPKAPKLDAAKAPPPETSQEGSSIRRQEPPKSAASAAPIQKNIVPMVQQKPVPVGSVAQFFAERCEPADGSAVSVADLLAAYRKWCDRQKAQPVATAVFVHHLEAVTSKVGVPISATPNGPTCENVKLSA